MIYSLKYFMNSTKTNVQGGFQKIVYPPKLPKDLMYA